MDSKKVSLTKLQKSEAHRILQSPDTSKEIHNRFQCLLLLEQGMSPTYISREMGISRYSVYRWKKRFLETGLTGLLDVLKRPGQKPNFSQQQVLQALAYSSSKVKSKNIISRSTIHRVQNSYHLKNTSFTPPKSQKNDASKTNEKTNQKLPFHRVTHQDIAQKAKVSASTVSLVLSNSSRLSQKTKEKVLLWASRLGYRRNAGLYHLASSRWKNHSKPLSIALLTGNRLTNPRFLYMKEKAKELGYSFEIFQLDIYHDYKRLSHILYQRGVQGVIIFNVKEKIKKLHRQIDWRHFSVISFGQKDPICNSVTCTYAVAAGQVWEKVWSRGYRRIGIAVPDDRRNIYTELFVKQHEKLKASERIPIFTLPPEENPKQFQTWLKKHTPEVLISTWYYFPDFLNDLGYHVPKDIAFAHLTLSFFHTRNISGMDLNHKFTCLKALELLDNQIRFNQLGLPKEKVESTVPTQWCEGKTLPKKKKP